MHIRIKRFLFIPLIICLGVLSRAAEEGPELCIQSLSDHLWSDTTSGHHEFLRGFSTTNLPQLMANLFRQYPVENRYLLGEADVSPEAAAAKPYSESPSLKYAGIFRPEFDRTQLSVWLLRLILGGTDSDFASFVEAQTTLPEFLRLDRSAFAELHGLFLKVLGSDVARLDALIAYMEVHDLEKTPAFREARQKITKGFFYEDPLGTRAPQLLPGLGMVRKDMLEQIRKASTANFDAIPQFAQGEAPAYSLRNVTGMGRATYDFAFLHSLLDVAGASGARSFKGSGSMILPVHKNYMRVYKELAPVAEGTAELIPTYWDFYFKNVRSIGLELDANVPEDRALARLIPMARISSRSAAETFIKTFRDLPQNIRALLGSELSQTGFESVAFKLEYSPALFAAAATFVKKRPEFSLERAHTEVFQTLARIFGQARQQTFNYARTKGESTLSIRKLAIFAEENLDQLRYFDFKITSTSSLEMDFEFKKRAAIDIENLPQFSIADLPKKKVILVGMGGGSDAIQAAALGKLIEMHGGKVSAIVSIRPFPGQSAINIQKAVSNPFQDVYEIGPETHGSVGSTGRFLENAFAKDFRSYLVLDNRDLFLGAHLQDLQIDLGGDAYFIGIDTGFDSGTSLQDPTGSGFQASPDQDHRVLLALAQAAERLKVPFLSMAVAPGIDSPEDVSSVLRDAKALFMFPNEKETEVLLSSYRQWHADGSNPNYFGLTMFTWQEALKGQTGWVPVPIPTDRVLDNHRKPWLPFGRAEAATRGILLMDGEAHLAAIGFSKIPVGAYEYDKIHDFTWMNIVRKGFKSGGWRRLTDQSPQKWRSLIGSEIGGILSDFKTFRSLVFTGKVIGTKGFVEDDRGGTMAVIQTETETFEVIIPSHDEFYTK